MGTSEGAEQDKRIAPRRRVLKPARIIYNHGRNVIECTIRNISDTGAQIDAGSAVELPASFWVSMHDGTLRGAELVWRNSNLLGIRFADGHQSQPCAIPNGGGKESLVARIADIERQIAELRAEIMNDLRE